ncbi:hypothetical protein U1Q18_033196 [Sarracenia purpurea var. burkii]
MEGSFPSDEETQVSASKPKRGGWITFPFIAGSLAGLTLGGYGWISNLIVYMIDEFNVQSVDAAQIWNVVGGCTLTFPLLAGILADSFLGSFSVIWISSLISLLGITLLVLSATVDSLRPPPCENGSSLCLSPSKTQFAVLYLALTLATIGVAGTRFTLGTIGADQFDGPKHRRTYFNWYSFTIYISIAISSTVIVYVQDNVSWGWGFGLCAAANVVGLVIFLLGCRFYRRVRPQGSPFVGLARVAIAAFRKRNSLISLESEDYYHKSHDGLVAPTPTKTFKFLNRAALITKGDIREDGSIANLWKLCTLQQVEDLKTLIKLFPLWLTGIILCTPLDIQTSLAILQALTMDCHLGPHFKIPAGTMLVFIMVSTCITIVLVDRFLFPLWQNLTVTGRFPPPLQRIGVGHVLCFSSMAVSAVVESKRLKIAGSHKLQNQDDLIVPMSVFWLVPQLALAGAGEAFHFPGNAALFYQEFPVSLKSTSTALVAMFFGLAFFLSTAVVGLFRRVTTWLPDNINQGRMDNVYWVLFGLGVINFSFYLVCAWFYKYQGTTKVEDDESSPDN